MTRSRDILNEIEEVLPDPPESVFKVLHDAWLKSGGHTMWTPHLHTGPYSGEVIVVVKFRDGTETVVDSMVSAEQIIRGTV